MIASYSGYTPMGYLAGVERRLFGHIDTCSQSEGAERFHMNMGNYAVERPTGNCVAGAFESLYSLSVENDLSSDTHPDRERMRSSTKSVNS